MADGYWRYSDARQPPPSSMAAASSLQQQQYNKRPRSDYDIPGGHGLPGYYSREDEKAGHRVIRDSDSIGASYDHYLRSGQIPSYGGRESGRSYGGMESGRSYGGMESGRSYGGVESGRSYGGESGRSASGALVGHHPVDDLHISSVGSFDPAAGKGQSFAIGGKSTLPLPPDASNTLFVEGLPGNCSRREVSHIFRPFVGFKEVRLVNKEARHSGGEPLVLCFVDFGTPAEAATALDALQGYKFDEHDRDSAILRLQFARHPGPRPSGRPRGRR